MNNTGYSSYYNNIPQRMPIVNGREGAESYRLAPDSNAILMDNSGKMIWIIATDSAGYRTVQAYDITLHVEPAPPDFNLLMARMSKMEEMLSGLVSASNNTGATTQPNNAGSITTGHIGNSTAEF